MIASFSELIKKIESLLMADAKFGRDYSKRSHQFGYKLHLLSYLMLMSIGFIFVLDFFLNSNSLVSSIASIATKSGIGIHPDYLDLINSHTLQNTIKVFWAFCIPFSLCLIIISSLYFYMAHGYGSIRKELVKFYWHGYFIPSLLRILIGSFLVTLLLIATYLFGLGFPEWLHLAQIPLFFIVQIFLISKLFAIITEAGMEIIITIFPYGLHPKSM